MAIEMKWGDSDTVCSYQGERDRGCFDEHKMFAILLVFVFRAFALYKPQLYFFVLQSNQSHQV